MHPRRRIRRPIKCDRHWEHPRQMVGLVIPRSIQNRIQGRKVVVGGFKPTVTRIGTAPLNNILKVGAHLSGSVAVSI